MSENVNIPDLDETLDMESAVKYLSRYMNTYHKHVGYRSYETTTYVNDVLYGLGRSISEEFEFASGFARFKRILHDHLAKDFKTLADPKPFPAWPEELEALRALEPARVCEYCAIRGINLECETCGGSGVIPYQEIGLRRVIESPDLLEFDDDGTFIHLHSETCSGYCDFACGPGDYSQGLPYAVGDRVAVMERHELNPGVEASEPTVINPEPLIRKSVDTPVMVAIPGSGPDENHPEFSRLTLEVVAVRIERWNEVRSDQFEALVLNSPRSEIYQQRRALGTASTNTEYSLIWDRHNPDRPARSNPWVMVLTVRREQA